jgi:hypothetical protein
VSPKQKNERPDLTDEVVVVLQRVHPGEMEKGELIEETGLTDSDLREVISYLEETGELDPKADGYRWNDRSEPADIPGLADPDNEDLEESLQPSDAQAAAGRAEQARTELTVLASFTKGPGMSDKALVTKAQQVATEVGNVLAAAMPQVDFHVEVSSVEAFTPRPIWPPPTE